MDITTRNEEKTKSLSQIKYEQKLNLNFSKQKVLPRAHNSVLALGFAKNRKFSFLTKFSTSKKKLCFY